ncbi:MAG: alpha/beta hydrolase [Gemmatimonadota bacterium]|nr:MAG: alpha/beta hydrolase [Gemmatimonadota bacterium]
MATVTKTPFELVGADAGPLRGDVRTQEHGRGRPAVIICHGFKGFKDWGHFPHLADRLARAGMTAVSFNFSGSGVGPDGESFSEPERFGHATYSNDLADLETVATALEAGTLLEGLAKPTALGVFGHSRGGGLAVLFAAGNAKVKVLVTWAAIGKLIRWDDGMLDRLRQEGRADVVNMRTGEVLPLYTDVLEDFELHKDGKLDLDAAAERIRVPWLIVHGAQDEAVSLSDGERLYTLAQGSARLEIIPGGTHTLGARHPWAGFTPELERGMDLTTEWFTRHLT